MQTFFRVRRAVIRDVLLVLVAIGVGSTARAQVPRKGEPTASPTVRSVGSLTSPLDVVLAVDNSGSMKETDPRFLIRDVVAGFAGRLSPQSRLGIVIFDKGAKLVLPLTSRSSAGFQKRVSAALAHLSYGGRYTNIPAGIERSLYALRVAPHKGFDRAIIFFTDGVVDVGSEARDLAQARWLRRDLAGEAKKEGIPIFGIALTNAADFNLIQSVSETTGGSYYRVLSAKEIPGVFDQLVAQIGRLAKERAEAAATAKEKERTVVVKVPVTTTPSASSPTWFLAAAALLLLGLVVLLVLLVLRSGGKGASSVPPAFLQVVGGAGSGEEPYALRKVVTRIGREKGANDVVIPHDTVSARHADIEFRDGSFFVRDAGSGNGTYVNGSRIGEPGASARHRLEHGDRVRFDAYEYQFLRDEVEASPAPAAQAGRTMLRAPAPVGAEPPPASPLAREEEGEARTTVKPEFCPNHQAWRATELCPSCQGAFCRNCMVESGGATRCRACAENRVQDSGSSA